ncbi:MAG: nucleoside hydrolase [Anaerorhabdus sp.]
MQKKNKIIIDCDPGHDDAIALLLAFSSEKLDVLGVTVTGGNQTLEKTLQNAKNVLEYVKTEVPICEGLEKPLFRNLEIAPSVHGETGLDGPAFIKSEKETHNKSAIEFIRDTLEKSKESITIVATGPLTNIGAFLISYPKLKHKIKEIVIMGGAVIGGNWSASAEFNILVDPEAAHIVFNSGIKMVMAGLDVTHKALIYPDEIEEIRKINHPVSTLVAELLDFFIIFHKNQGFKGAPLHDPCTIAYLIKPEIFTSKEYFVDIETDGEYTTGSTVVDQNNILCRDPTTLVLLDIDQKEFFSIIYDAMLEYKRR